MRSRSNAFSLIGIVICLAASGSDGRDIGVDAAFHLKEALVALRASDAVWRRNDAEFRAMRKTGLGSEAETRQFAEFVAEQRRFMLEDCREVRRLGGDPESLGFDCALPSRRDVASIGAPGEAAGVPTVQEKDEALERRLNRLEGDLDDLFKSKQDQMRRDPARQGPPRGASGGDRAGSGAGGAAKSGAGTAKAGQELGSNPGVNKPAGAGSNEVRRAAGAPSGDDDDVVARQLREAAEKETDPVMKEKLWEEYRKYKEATS